MDPLRCDFRTISRHETSLGRVRYQACSCGRFRVLLDWEPIVPARAPRAEPPCTVRRE